MKRYSRWWLFWDTVCEFLPYLAVLAVVCLIDFLAGFALMSWLIATT